MVKNFLKLGVAAVAFSIVSAFVLALLLMFGFMRLIWDFPSSWEVIRGLDGPPRQLISFTVPDDIYRLRSERGQAFACQGTACTPEDDHARSEEDVCDAATQPAVTHFFPYLLSWHVRGSLACEKSHMDTGRTVYIVSDDRGLAYVNTGVSLLPTDAAVIGVGLMGAVTGGTAALFLVLILAGFHTMRNRGGKEPRASIQKGD